MVERHGRLVDAALMLADAEQTSARSIQTGETRRILLQDKRMAADVLLG
jgi:hypothetical protein